MSRDSKLTESKMGQIDALRLIDRSDFMGCHYCSNPVNYEKTKFPEHLKVFLARDQSRIGYLFKFVKELLINFS